MKMKNIFGVRYKNNFVRSQLSFLTSESFVRVVGYEGAQAINIRLQVNITDYRLHYSVDGDHV